MLTRCLNTHTVMELGFLCFLCLAGFVGVDGIMFHLEPNSRKCIREEHQANVVMTGEYEVSEAYNQIVDYIVTDSKNHVLSRGEKITRGKFSFVTENFDTSEFCFISKTHQQHPEKHEVSLIIKRGVEAKSYDGVEEAAKLKPMEVELRKLEDLSEEIVKDFSLMRKNEEEMRNTNESTNRRVLYFTVFSMCCLLGLATWQVLYLRSFFKAKKLIE